MAKWDYLRGKFPKVPLDAGYQEKLDAVKGSPVPIITNGEILDALSSKTFGELSSSELKDVYLAHRNRADILTEQLKTFNLIIEVCTRMFVERFEEEGEASIKFDDGVSLGHTVEPYPFVKDQKALLAWVKANNLEAILTLNYQTMASLVKERLEGKVNEPLPDGVDVFMKDKLTCRGRSK